MNARRGPNYSNYPGGSLKAQSLAGQCAVRWMCEGGGLSRGGLMEVFSWECSGGT